MYEAVVQQLYYKIEKKHWIVFTPVLDYFLVQSVLVFWCKRRDLTFLNLVDCSLLTQLHHCIWWSVFVLQYCPNLKYEHDSVQSFHWKSGFYLTLISDLIKYCNELPANVLTTCYQSVFNIISIWCYLNVSTKWQ